MDPDYESIIHAYLDAYLVQWHIIYLVKSGIFNQRWRHFASVTGEFFVNLRYMISTYTKDFPWKKDPNLPDFEELFFHIVRFLS
jgi:hypothetical protein